ncbi:MAG: flavoprotein [Anaerolineae bacterium]
MIDEALVDKVVARILALINGEPIDITARNVLMLFSGASTGFVVGMEAIKRLTCSQHTLTIVLTPSASHVITEAQVRKAGAGEIIGPNDWANAPELVRRSDVVLIPTLSMNLAARLALGLMDSLISTLVIGSLLAGKAVVAVKDGADPNGKAGLVFGAAAGAAPTLRATLEGHLTTLASYGVELVNEGDFLVTVERRLLTGAVAQPVSKTVAQPAFIIPSPFTGVETYQNGTKPILSPQPICCYFNPALCCVRPGSRLTPQAQIPPGVSTEISV